MGSLLLGLDVGTGSVKTGLFDLDGNVLSRACAPLQLYSPEPGWAEQDPAEWWSGACQALNEVLRGVAPEQVAAVGLSGQCPGHALVDPTGQPLGRAIIWRDQRAFEEAAWLCEHISPEQALEWVGTSQVGEAVSPPARLLWLRAHRSADWERAAHVLQPKDFLALQLTGMAVTDRYSTYNLASPETGRYAPGYFQALGIPLGMMPTIQEPTGLAGQVTPEAARLTGLAAGTPVVAGTIDAYCDILACGGLQPGRAVDVAGTSEFVSLGTTRPVEAPGLYPSSFGAVGAFLCGPTQAGGDTLRWLARCMYAGLEDELPYDRLEADARSVPAGSLGLVFLPYLNGERAPLWDPQARAGFFGLTLAHERRHYTRAVYESIGFVIRHILEIAETAAGSPAGEVIVCGGGSRSRFWNQVKADILQRPVRPTLAPESACLGAAMLAAAGAGLHPDVQDASARMAQFGSPFRPDPLLKDAYDMAYRKYRALYPAVKSID
jgi:xylulokinase